MKDALRNPLKFLMKYKWEIAPILVIVVAKLVLHATNFTEFPYYENDEATYAIRALSFREDDTARVVSKLIASDIPFDKRDDRVVVPADAAMGVTIAFSQASQA